MTDDAIVRQPKPTPTTVLDCGGRSLDLSKPQIMGVLNVTPDSFSDGGTYFLGGQLSLDKTLSSAEQMCREGATIIDVGGESTRPGAATVSLAQEMDRVLPVVQAISERMPVVVSVDTSTPELMLAARKAGAGLINDVRALQKQGALAAAAETGLPVCLMHMQGSPQTMQAEPVYDRVVEQVYDFLHQRVQAAVAAGVPENKLLLDPGFGFGKTLEHNLQLMNRLDYFEGLGLPLLAGLSRKSMIGQVLDKPVEERLIGSVTLAALAVYKGARIIRCHDVAATADAVKLAVAVVTEGQSLDQVSG